MDVFNSINHIDDDKRAEKLEAFNLQAAWSLLKNYHLQESKKKFLSTKFDIRELILLYPEYIPPNNQ